MISRSRQIWMRRAQELAQDLTHHWAHIYVGALIPLIGAATGWYAWQWGSVIACLVGVMWEVGGAIIVPEKNGWRASVIGMLAFGAGAAIASAVLLISGR